MFSPGDLVEFLSSEQGGTWKIGVVVSPMRFYDELGNGETRADRECPKSVRIRVGDDVYVMRPVGRCRVIGLPIVKISGHNPPRFRWKQLVSDGVVNVVVDHEGTLDPTIERVVERLLSIAEHALRENTVLREELKGVSDRLVKQGEELERLKAETVATVAVPAPEPTRRGKR